MEVKINREIRNYTESMFFGLSMRQFVFSVLACGVAVGLVGPLWQIGAVGKLGVLRQGRRSVLGFRHSETPSNHICSHYTPVSRQ